MCGITGAVWTDPARAVSAEALAAMTDAIVHRGPDERGVLRSDLHHNPPYADVPGMAFGFRRLSILDVSRGHQPMATADGRTVIVFNGEIYNYAELRRRLEGVGFDFETDCDTEVLLKLFVHRGVEGLSSLNGMFAFAVWEAGPRRLTLVRDRLGKKPLYYCHQDGRLAFASELKSLLRTPGVPKSVDPVAIDEYLTYQYVPDPRTIYTQIRKLPPGHVAVYENDRLTVRPYWNPDFSEDPTIREAEASERLRTLLTEAVQLRLRSDVPLGAFLSGGVDSSLMVAIAQAQLPHPVKTFSIGFEDPAYDESAYANQVASHLGTDHHTLTVTGQDLKILPTLAYVYDEPFADSSAIPTWWLSRLTRQQVTVALSGDGGDELFLGYQRYRAVGIASALDRVSPVRQLVGSPLWQRLPEGPGAIGRLFRKARRFSDAVGKPPARRYLDWVSVFPESVRGRLYSDAFLESLGDQDPVRFLAAAWARVTKRSPRTAAGLTDLMTYLPCDLMTKVDRASMANSLEVRCPFLDVNVVEFAARLPERFKIRHGRGKYLLRKAFGHLLPEAIWTRPKMGFGVPLAQWFREDLKTLAHDTLTDTTAQSRGWFDPTAITSMLDEHASRQADHGYRLWTLLMLELWARTWLDQDRPAPPDRDAMPPRSGGATA